MLGATPVPRLLNRIPDGLSSFFGKFSLFIYLTRRSAIFAVMIWLPQLAAVAKIAAATLVYALALYALDAIRHKKSSKQQ